MATLVRRASRLAMLVKVEGKDTNSVVGALKRHIQSLPEGVMRTLTWDRGTEMAQHKQITLATNVDINFCDPHAPSHRCNQQLLGSAWQRGTNENTNRLLHQYFPKKTNLAVHSQDDLDLVAMRLNTRPRKTLGFKTLAYQ